MACTFDLKVIFVVSFCFPMYNFPDPLIVVLVPCSVVTVGTVCTTVESFVLNELVMFKNKLFDLHTKTRSLLQ